MGKHVVGVRMSECCVLVLLRLVCLRACLDVCDVFLAGCQVFLSCVLVGYLCRLWGGRSCVGLLPDVLVMAYCRVEWGCTCFEFSLVLRFCVAGADCLLWFLTSWVGVGFVCTPWLARCSY